MHFSYRVDITSSGLLTMRLWLWFNSLNSFMLIEASLCLFCCCASTLSPWSSLLTRLSMFGMCCLIAENVPADMLNNSAVCVTCDYNPETDHLGHLKLCLTLCCRSMCMLSMNWSERTHSPPNDQSKATSLFSSPTFLSNSWTTLLHKHDAVYVQNSLGPCCTVERDVAFMIF